MGKQGVCVSLNRRFNEAVGRDMPIVWVYLGPFSC